MSPPEFPHSWPVTATLCVLFDARPLVALIDTTVWVNLCWGSRRESVALNGATWVDVVRRNGRENGRN